MNNKYQEALDFIVKSSCPQGTTCKKCSFNMLCNREAKYYVEKLQELIDKATPKKPILKAMDGFSAEVASHLVCPNCDKPIVNVWSKAEYKPRYCHYCGQNLDWS